MMDLYIFQWFGQAFLVAEISAPMSKLHFVHPFSIQLLGVPEDIQYSKNVVTNPRVKEPPKIPTLEKLAILF